MTKTPLQALIMNNLVTSWLHLGKLISFRCFNIVDKQRRTIDVIENSGLATLASHMHHLDFRYIQKSQVYILENSKIIIVSNQEGPSLAQSVVKSQSTFDEARLRKLLKDLLEAIVYLNKQFDFDFSFKADDILHLEKNYFEDNEKHNERFKFKNCFLQKFCLNLDRRIGAASKQNNDCERKRWKNDQRAFVSEKCIRSLGVLAVELIKNRFGFNDMCLDLNAPWLSESLRELIVEMANFRPAFGKTPESFLASLMSVNEFRDERYQLSRLVKPSQLRRSKSQEIRQSY